jgi:hypothetical protein
MCSRAAKHIWTTLTICQVPQDLRLDLAPAASLSADDISWTSMTRHIVWYIEQPEGKPPLRTWSKDNATHFALAKHGVHTAASRAPTGARSHGQHSRTGAGARPHRRPGAPAGQGKAEPARPSIITVAGLRTSTGRPSWGARLTAVMGKSLSRPMRPGAPGCGGQSVLGARKVDRREPPDPESSVLPRGAGPGSTHWRDVMLRRDGPPRTDLGSDLS